MPRDEECWLISSDKDDPSSSLSILVLMHLMGPKKPPKTPLGRPLGGAWCSLELIKKRAFCSPDHEVTAASQEEIIFSDKLHKTRVSAMFPGLCWEHCFTREN